MTLSEDASQVRTNGAPEVLAALNGGLLALMDFIGVKNVAKQMRHFCAQPQEASTIAAWQIIAGKRVNQKALQRKIGWIEQALEKAVSCRECQEANF